MKRKILGWIGVIGGIFLVLVGVFGIIIHNYVGIIAIPAGIFAIIKYLPKVRANA